MSVAPSARHAWRVAALSMMPPAELCKCLSGSHAGAWVEAAAACGVTEAQIRLGRMALAGEGVAKDARRAFILFARAAATGDADALNMLGRCHENGWGTEPDPARAAQCFAAAAQAGHAWAQYNLGHMLLDGNGVARDPVAASSWYRRAAAQGHVRAMNLVGRCCEHGWGTRRDPAAARAWYRRSAEGGYFRGAYNYASTLAEGGNIADAIRWFERALSDAPVATRNAMLSALRHHVHPEIRMIALRKSPTFA